MKTTTRLFHLSGACEVGLTIMGLIALALVLSGCITMPTATPKTATPAMRATVSPLPSPIQETCTVTGERVYLRAGAGMNFEALEVTHKGDVMKVITQGEWLKVETFDRTTGYIYSKFCKGA